MRSKKGILLVVVLSLVFCFKTEIPKAEAFFQPFPIFSRLATSGPTSTLELPPTCTLEPGGLVHVVHPGDSIQLAIETYYNSGAPYTIQLEVGNYDESIQLMPGVIIKGSGSGTVIKAIDDYGVRMAEDSKISNLTIEAFNPVILSQAHRAVVEFIELKPVEKEPTEIGDSSRGTAIKIEGTEEALITHNHMKEPFEIGIDIKDSSDMKIYYNLIQAKERSHAPYLWKVGIRVSDSESGSICNNTIYLRRLYEYGLYAYGIFFAGASSSFNIYNNIIAGDDYSSFGITSDISSDENQIVVDYNFINCNTLHVELGSHNITDIDLEPGFVGNGDFSLDEGSPCRGAGVAIEGVTPVGIKHPDMGAFQHYQTFLPLILK